MVGGSSGTAVAGMLKIAQRFRDDDVVVVLLPDSGERYIIKIYNDDWMRENGFLAPEKVTARYVLRSKGKDAAGIVAIGPSTQVWEALHLMRENNIPQLPVLENGTVGGILTRHDVIEFMGK